MKMILVVCKERLYFSVASVPVSDDRQLFSFLTGGGSGSKEASGEVGEVLGSLGLTAAQLSILGGLLAARLGLQAAPVVAGAASNAYSGLTTVTLSRYIEQRRHSLIEKASAIIRRSSCLQSNEIKCSYKV